MKTLAYLIVVAGSLAACVEEGPAPANTLPGDAHYVMLPDGYASPEDCLANEPQIFSCQLSLSLCANGRAGERRGDLVLSGMYTMDGPIAHVTFEQDSPIDFDVQSVVQLDAPQVDWIVDNQRRWDTLQFDNIDCSRR